ncbi:hypothetical protein Tco_0794842 [Tanacetum coccineum]
MTSYIFHMAQQIIPASQLVPKFQGIGRCKNNNVLQSIPCSPECKISARFLTPRIPSENPFVVPATIEIIESFMHRVGYQGVVDKDVIQYPHFTKLIITDLMKKYPSISSRLEEDYYSIKDDISLVSVYTTGNVTIRGMLIPDAFLTEEIHATDDYKEYETVFVNVVVLMNQPQPVVSTQGTHRSTPRAHRTPTLIAASPQGKKRKQSAGEINRIEPGSHKKHSEVVNDDDDDDDDDNKEEKKDEKEGDEMGSLETKIEKMQTPIPTTPRSPRINLSSDKNIVHELMDTVPLLTATTSKDPHKKIRISSKYSHLPGALRKM